MDNDPVDEIRYEFFDGILINDTIERCAQVIDAYSTGLGTVMLSDIASAIRALKK